jgi:WD40 repeat protein
VLGVLADARLLSIDEDTVVVAHEALIRHWPRLRAWIDADRAGLLTHRRLTQAAREWNALEREQAALYRGARLAAAREWVPDHAAGLSRLEREFLSASEAAHRRERTVRRRGVALVLAALTTGLVAAVVAAVFANEQRDIAESRDLAAKSSALVATDPWVALALAFEALRHSDTEQAREALRQATLAQRAKYVIPAHSGILFGVAPSPDGRLAATAGGDRIVRIWSVATGRRVGEIRGYGGEVRAVSFSPDSKHLVSAASDGEIAVALATGGTRHVVARLRGGEYASSIDFGADARTVVIGTSAGRVALVGLGDGALHDLGPRSTEYVEAVAFDKRARKVVSAGDDGMARIWNVAGGAPVVLGHGNDARGAGQIVAAAFRPDGRQVATVDELGSVLLWDARTGRRLNEIAIGDKQQASVRFSADGARIVTAGVDGVVHLWRPREHAALAEFRGHHGQVRAAFVPGHDEIVSAGEEDGTLRIWTVPSTKVPPQPGVAPRFSNDGRLVVSIAPDDATLHVWNPKTGEDRTYGGLQKINSARFSPDGTQLVGASSDGRVMLWDVASGQAHPVHTGEGEKLDVAMDPSGTRIAFGGNVPLVIQSTDGTHVVRLRGHRGRVNALVFSPDGRHLLTGSDDTTARIWNARTGALERTVSAHQGVVGSVSYSKDGARFATAGSDGTVALWRVAGGEPVILAGHTLAVNSAEFNPRGDRVVTAGEDGTVRVWNAAGGDPIVVLDRYEQSADGADFSRDGRYVVSAAGDGMRLSLCEVCGSAADVLRLARTRAQHTLTALERRRLLPGG